MRFQNGSTSYVTYNCMYNNELKMVMCSGIMKRYL